MAFFPTATQDDFTGRKGIFDYDGVIFLDLWKETGKYDFNAGLRHISDYQSM